MSSAIKNAAGAGGPGRGGNGEQHQSTMRPHPDEPGSWSEQFDAVGIYLDDPALDREDAWQRARALTMRHARRAWLARRASR